MDRSKLYLPNGYANMAEIMTCPTPFIVCIGGRGTGKTYGALREVLTSDPLPRFGLLRRSQTQIDIITKPDFNPAGPLNRDLGLNIVTAPVSKYTGAFYHGNEEGRPAGPALGYLFALSTFGNIRGFSAELDLVIYDEFIPESTARPIKDEGAALLNLYESLNRNRELDGRPPLKMLLLSNTNDLNSPILQALGVLDLCDRMARKNQWYGVSRSGMVTVIRLQDSPISERKKKTVLYRLQNEDFERMALGNAFSRDNYDHVRAQPLQEYRPLVTVAGITCYEHRSGEGRYYVTRAGAAAETYDDTPSEIKRFKAGWGWLWLENLGGRVWYSDAASRLAFSTIFC